GSGGSPPRPRGRAWNGRSSRHRPRRRRGPRSGSPSLFGGLRQVLPKTAPDPDDEQLYALADLLAQHALLLPAVVDDGLLCGLVGRRNPAIDLVGAELLEGLQVGEALGLAAHSPATDSIVTHDRSQLRRRLAVEAIERGEADGILDLLDLDRPLAVLGLRVLRLLDGPLDPALRILLGELTLPVLEQIGRRCGRVEPAVDGRGVLRPEAPERDAPGHQPSPACSRSAAFLSGESGAEPAYSSTASVPAPPSSA